MVYCPHPTAFRTRTLFDLLLGGPSRHSVREWRDGIAVHLIALLRPSGQAYLLWHWMYRHGIGDKAERDEPIIGLLHCSGWSDGASHDDMV